MKTFEQELQELINRYSKESGSDTPDFMLAEYLYDCLIVFGKTMKARDKWYGKEKFTGLNSNILEKND